jgi:ubiquinone/menaquinone biosynthesis C-methylase UbiE
VTDNTDIQSQFFYKGRKIQRSSETRPEAMRRREQIKRRVGNAMKKSVSDLDAKRVLDVGTGFGSNVKRLAMEFGGRGKVWSIDPSPVVLQEARWMLRAEGLLRNVRLVQAQAEKIPVREGYFGLVTAVMLIHHLANPQSGLQEMVRVLSDGGKLILADWRPVASEVVPHRARDFPRAKMVGMILDRLGLSVKLREYRYWYLIVGTKSTVKKKHSL